MRVGSISRLSGRLAVGALVLGVLPLLSPSAALAGPPAPRDLTPNSSSASVPGAPVLSWSRVSGAVEYDVQVATSPDFGSVLYDKTTENSQATPPTNLPANTDLYWRVRGVSATHSRGAWATEWFAHDADGGPLLVTPEPDAQLQQPDDSPLMTWQPVPRATSFSVSSTTRAS